MSTLRDIVAQIGDRLGDPLPSIHHRWFIQKPDRLHILPYRSFGTPQRLRLAGRVLASQHELSLEDEAHWWDNLGDMIHRFASREVAGVTLRAALGSETAIGTSDEEGYFSLELRSPRPQPSGWQLIDLLARGGRSVSTTGDTAPVSGDASATAEVLVPPLNAQFGVISDVDDTIVLTHASRMLKMARMVLLNNARTRLPFPGVAAFYRALQNGRTGTTHPTNNPIFYVSSSAWNIYDLLVDFLAHNDIPAGPLLLADYGISQGSFPFTSHDTHKRTQIERILATYPDLPFILIGDSGQRDPAIYRQVAAEMPGRVLAIYIRSVRTMAAEQVESLGGKGASRNVEMVTAYDTLPLARHAMDNGWIDAAALPQIGDDAEKDQSEPSALEALLDPG